MADNSSEDETPEVKPPPSSEIPLPNISRIKNKIRRQAAYIKLLRAKKKAKYEARQKRKEEAERLGDAAPKPVTRTLENTRERDETMIKGEDEEVEKDEATDEMASYFNKLYEPKVLITSADNPHTKTNRFCRELTMIIPNSQVLFRSKASLKKLAVKAHERGFSDMIVINEDRRKPNALLLVHLPEGPTAYFRMSNVKLCKQIKNCGEMTSHRPEIILNNFSTRLGHTVSRMLASIFHYDPQFRGRRVVTLHNQRDYIFFRHHRYEFRNAAKVGLHELGPRFTLRLKSLQKGTFDSKFGEFEWVLKRHEMETSRRKFHL
ncbi:Ribosome production factor 1 [Chamberlinius hualienensis]